MNRKTQRLFSFFLTAIVIVIMAGVYFLQIRKSWDDIFEEPPSTSVTLISREESEVEEIIYSSRNGEQITLSPYTDTYGILQWAYSGDYILTPFLLRDKARPAWVLTAVGTVDSSNLELFELEPPLLTIDINYFDGTNHTLKLGSQTTDYNYYFLMIDENPVIYLINAVLGERLLYNESDMLDMSFPEINIAEAEYIKISERGRGEIVLGLGESSHVIGLPEIGGEQLVMYEPINGLNISTSRLIESVIYPVSQMRFIELAHIHPTDLAVFGLEEPALEFIFRTAQNEIHFSFGNIFGEFIYVKTNRPHVFITRVSSIITLFDLDALNIAERHLAPIAISDVESVIIENDKVYILIMNHVPGAFEIEPEVNGVFVDDNAFRTAFIKIISLIADADIEPFFPQGEPEITITHKRINNPDTQIRFFNYNTNFLAVSVDGGEAIFVTNRAAIGRLFEYLEGLIP